MDPAARARLHVGLCQPLPPAISGVLAAWLRAGGSSVEVLRDSWGEGGALWIALEAPVPLLVDVPEATFFGPALADPALVERLLNDHPHCTVAPGDPTGEPDLGRLPITTWAGFDLPPGGPRRILAGRRDRVRPLAHVLRELAYAVEMQGVGHVFFDDEDLAHYGDWLSKFEAELARLPWPVRWEGTVDGAREAGGRLG
jgi:hypothetical protein